jgi:hypothetical protein
VFVYSQAKHRPRIVRRFCLNHDLAHRVPSSTPTASVAAAEETENTLTYRARSTS